MITYLHGVGVSIGQGTDVRRIDPECVEKELPAAQVTAIGRSVDGPLMAGTGLP
jgi:hypothetical protein